MSYPIRKVDAFDFFEFNEAAETVSKNLENHKELYGFTKEELLERGASEEAIRLVKQKYELQRQYPNGEYAIIDNEIMGKNYVLVGNKSATESYRMEMVDLSVMGQMEAANIRHYKKLTTEMIEDALVSLGKK